MGETFQWQRLINRIILQEKMEMSTSNLNALYSQYPLPIKEQQHRTFLKLFIVMSQSISKALMLICLVLMRILMKILMNFIFCFKTFLAQIPNSTTYFHTYFNIQTLHHRGSTQNCKNSSAGGWPAFFADGNDVRLAAKEDWYSPLLPSVEKCFKHTIHGSTQFLVNSFLGQVFSHV